ncbi:MAG: MFS transporter [Bacteroidota bacterium]
MTPPVTADKKVIRAWAMYDWANSVYPLVINSTIFPIYYKVMTAYGLKGDAAENAVVDFFGFKLYNMVLYSYAISVAYLIIAAFSPILSGIADYSGSKKKFLRFFCYLGSLSCILFITFNQTNVEWGILLVIMACIGFSGSIPFYNAFLPEIAPKDQQDAVSAKGFSYGYTGSVILLVINLAMVLSPKTFGLEDEIHAFCISFVMVGLWWAGFAQITFRKLHETPTGKKVDGEIIRKGYRELIRVWNELKNNPVLKKYLGSFFVFNMAVQTVMLLATTFALTEVKQYNDAGVLEPMGSDKLITSILIIQVVAIPGAYFFSWLSGKQGNLRSLYLALAIWIGVCIGAYFVQVDTEFFVVAAIVGLIMGGIQSMSRSTYSKLLPETVDHASYFSFYDVADKMGIVVGTFAYGLIFQLTGSMRNSVLAIVVFFVLGLILLLRVPKVSNLLPSANKRN